MGDLLFAGADPGSEGAVVIIDQDARLVASLCTAGLEPVAISAWLREHDGKVTLCALEKVSARPQDGGASAFEFGRSAGIFEGLLIAFRMPLVLVRPQSWQASGAITKPQPLTASDIPPDDRSQEKRDASAKGKYRRQLKRAIMQHARRRWPELPVTTQETWGMCDAIFLADHARKLHLGHAIPKETRKRPAPTTVQP
jgi:hypothetical protein